MKKKRIVSAVAAMLTAVGLAVPAHAASAENAPFAGQGYAGVFISEARGNAISTADMEKAVKDWASDSYGKDKAISVTLSSKERTVASGDTATVQVGKAKVPFGIIIVGDAAKTGKPGLAQLVNVAMGISGGLDNDPIALTAADLNGSGSVDLTDVVAAAKFLKEPDPEGPVIFGTPLLIPRDAAESTNKFAQNYIRWASPVRSYLYENAAGNLVRVEYIGDEVIIEEYNEGLMPVNSKAIQAELPIWGGFFNGDKYNFLIWGQENRQQDDNREVVRIVKYDKAWNRLGAATLRGANTTVPFDAGSLRCAEAGDYLYVRTSHEMYTAPDGRNHQSNMMLNVRQSDMQITDGFADIANINYGYISHSFNQYILVDQYNNILAVDHGDGYPRAATMMMYTTPAGQDSFTDYYPLVQALAFEQFPGADGDNATGCSIGGFEETSKGYVAAYNFDGIGSNGPRDVYLAFITNSEGADSRLARLTEGSNSLTPQIVSTGMDGGLIMWMQLDDEGNPELAFARYSADGTVGKTTVVPDMAVSDCQPIVWNGRVVWYVTDRSAPRFYMLEGDTVRVL